MPGFNPYRKPNTVIYHVTTGGASTGAIGESVYSGMPGRENGPADAYRHIILAAELTRNHGEAYARSIRSS